MNEVYNFYVLPHEINFQELKRGCSDKNKTWYESIKTIFFREK